MTGSGTTHMAQIIDITGKLPRAAIARCIECGYAWIARQLRTDRWYTCPHCGSLGGMVTAKAA